MAIRTLLISCLLVGSVFGSATDQEDFVVFVWDAGSSAASTTGGGCTRAALDGEAGSITNFMGNGSGTPSATTGGPLVSQNALTIENQAGVIGVTDAGANGWFTSMIDGTIVQVANYSDNDMADGFFIALKIDNDTISFVGTTYVDDVGTADIDLGGAIDGIASLIASAADLVDASSFDCDILIKGNEIFTVDRTLSAGGGTASTLLSFLGVDSSWARVVPTRVVASGGTIANSLLDTSIMPKITLNTNVRFSTDQTYIQVDGIWFSGNNTGRMVGTVNSDFQIYSNCVFDNAGIASGSIALQSDQFGLVDNCDVIASGATGDTTALSVDHDFSVRNCIIRNDSSSAASKNLDLTFGLVSGCLFYDFNGTAIFHSDRGAPMQVMGCTFENGLTCISTPAQSSAFVFTCMKNIAANCTTFCTNLFSGTDNQIIYAAYNNLFNITNRYVGWIGEVDNSIDFSFTDISSDPLFVSEANDNYNLQATSPAKNAGPLLTNIGAMSDKEAGGGGGGGVVGVVWN